MLYIDIVTWLERTRLHVGERARTARRFWWPPSRRNEARPEHGTPSGAPASTRPRQLIAAARAIVTLRPRPDEGWNRAEPSSPCHSRCRLFFAAERWLFQAKMTEIDPTDRVRVVLLLSLSS